MRRAVAVISGFLLCASACQRFPGGGMDANSAQILAFAGILGSSSRWLTYDPMSVTGLRLWLKAEAISQSNGTSVTSWTDSSGTGNTVAAGAAPTYFSSTNTINGRPVVRFAAASNQYLSRASPTGLSVSDSGSMFLVSRMNSGATFTILHIGGVCNGGRQYSWVPPMIEMNKHCVGQVANPAVNWPVSSVHQLTVLQQLVSNITMRVDSVQVSSGVPAFTAYSGGALIVGTANNPAPPYADMDLAELLFYDNRISDADALSVECYLGARYGIQSCQ
jgi:hypothetical protein